MNFYSNIIQRCVLDDPSQRPLTAELLSECQLKYRELLKIKENEPTKLNDVQFIKPYSDKFEDVPFVAYKEFLLYSFKRYGLDPGYFFDLYENGFDHPFILKRVKIQDELYVLDKPIDKATVLKFESLKFDLKDTEADYSDPIQWYNSIGFANFRESLCRNGFDQFFIICELKEDDLIENGVTLAGHLRSFQWRIADLREWCLKNNITIIQNK